MAGIEELGTGQAGYTPEFVYVKGDYKIGNERVPYYCTSITVEQAVQTLQLPGEIVLNPTQPASLQELFQRELDEDRVKQEIVPYLKQGGRLKFFNSLTIALLPVEKDETLKIHDYFPESDPSAPMLPPQSENFDVKEAGPVRTRELQDGNIGYLSWNVQKVFPVIVDGQHRFAALKRLYQDTTFPHREGLFSTKLPLIILVPDERLGFKNVSGTNQSVLKAIRSIFIDLNKYSKTVHSARQYLLDDRDENAVSMRNILAGPQDYPKEDLEGSKALSKLPLSLVDWHSEAAKFDTGPYLTSVIALYEHVMTALDLPKYKSTNWKQVDEYLNTLEARLDISPKNIPSEPNLESLQVWRDRSQEEELPFSLRTEDVSSIGEAFESSLSPLVIRPLTEIKPYKELVDFYKEKGMLGSSFEHWLSLDVKGKRAFEDQMGPFGEEPSAIAYHAEKEIKGKFKRAYQVVYQKALVEGLVYIHDYRELVSHEWGLEHSTQENLISEWVRRIDSRVSNALSETECWRGTNINASGNVSWSQKAKLAISGQIVNALFAPFEEWESLAEKDSALEKASEWVLKRYNNTKSKTFDSKVEEILADYTKNWVKTLIGYEEELSKANNENLSSEAILERAANTGGKQLLRMKKGSQWI